jgi:hypothetical protein
MTRPTLIWILAVTTWAQSDSTQLPRFEDYPESEIYNSTPAVPKLTKPGHRLFRTRIREGATSGPNFAGHLTIVEWGCGSLCVSIVVVDARDGTIYRSPFSILGWGMPIMKYEGKYAPSQDGFQPLAYTLTSRLFIFRGARRTRIAPPTFTSGPVRI